jgi:hypothetical protein
MRKGTVSEIISHYTHNAFEDMGKALCQFFGMSIDKIMKKDLLSNEDLNGMFHEWFVFDFKFPHDKTPLEDFCDTNPLMLSPSDLEIYQQMRDEHIYSVFTAISSRPGRVEIKDVKDGKIYVVKEYTASHSIISGSEIVARVVLVGKRYEFSSDKIRSIEGKDGKGTIYFMKKIGTDRLTPKALYDLWYKKI